MTEKEQIPWGKPGDDWKTIKPLDLSNTHCACVDQDPIVCFYIRYHKNPLELTKEDVCECPCHDEYDDDDCDCHDCNDARIV